MNTPTHRIQRFKVGDIVVIAKHSPMETPGRRFEVAKVDSLPSDRDWEGRGRTAMYWLKNPGDMRDTIPLWSLWDWMLDPAGCEPCNGSGKHYKKESGPFGVMNTLESCPHCGGRLLGDGYTAVIQCENVEDAGCVEPDAKPVFCKP